MITLADYTLKLMTILKSDAFVISDSIATQLINLFTLVLSETISFLESTIKQSGIIKVESLTYSDYIRKSPSIIKADSVSITISVFAAMTKTLIESIQLIESIRKAISIPRTDSLAISDSYATVIIKILNLVENLQILESMATTMVIQKILTENLAIADAYRRIVSLGNLLVNVFASIVTDDISDHFDINRIITDDINGRFGSEL